jgi:hypothetical protein
MPNHNDRERRIGDRDRRVAWLAMRPDMRALLANGHGKRLFKIMQDAGLFSPTTYCADVNMKQYIEWAEQRAEGWHAVGSSRGRRQHAS